MSKGNPHLLDRVLFDTGVMMRALGDRPNEPVSALCRKLLDETVAAGGDVLLAAPSLSELMRQNGSPPPLTKQIEVVSFDLDCALLLGNGLSIEVLNSTKSLTGLSKTYLKYDAMIVACAIRHKAECIVSLDRDHTKLANGLIRIAKPHEFYPQMTLPTEASQLKRRCNHLMATINVAHEFSRFPYGRHIKDGPYSGEHFRKNFLVLALKSNSQLVVDLDGTLGYGSSFLEEAFGGLVRLEGFTAKQLKSILRVVSKTDPSLEGEIWSYIDSVSAPSAYR